MKKERKNWEKDSRHAIVRALFDRHMARVMDNHFRDAQNTRRRDDGYLVLGPRKGGGKKTRRSRGQRGVHIKLSSSDCGGRRGEPGLREGEKGGCIVSLACTSASTWCEGTKKLI